jgi:hypothetical protein
LQNDANPGLGISSSALALQLWVGLTALIYSSNLPIFTAYLNMTSQQRHGLW